MKTIICTGDSHTWGQGATGAIESVKDVCGGDRRPTVFTCPSYVNLIRKMIDDRHGAKAYEYYGGNIPSAVRFCEDTLCADISESALEFSHEAGLIRVVFYAPDETCGIKVTCDNAVTSIGQPRRYGCNTAYNLVSVKPTPGVHDFRIEALNKNAYIYRIEIYTGEYAVLNCGIGSCPAGLYKDGNWEEYVSALSPDIAIVEPHTINDWLTPETPEEYYETLKEYFGILGECGCRSIMLTVAPIFGVTENRFNGRNFDEYIASSVRAAEDSGVPVAYVNRTLKDMIKGLGSAEAFALTASDDWHPNDFGHSVYAKEAVKLLIKEKLIPTESKQ